ncbi:MAG: DUF308 domain-containing protein [Clostridia bacterium]|nr:DUF308 domain-containing protein [Clostridia bacterium]
MAKKSNQNSVLFTSFLYIIVGLLLVIFRSETLNWAMTITGAIFAICGVLELTKKNFAGGGVSLVIGIVILVLGWTLAGIVLLVLGILIAIKGVVDLLPLLKKKKPDIKALIVPVVTIVVGILLAFGNGLDILIIITGILLIVDGAIGLFAHFTK